MTDDGRKQLDPDAGLFFAAFGSPTSPGGRVLARLEEVYGMSVSALAAGGGLVDHDTMVFREGLRAMVVNIRNMTEAGRQQGNE